MKCLISLLFILNVYNSISAMRQPLALCFYRHDYNDGEASVALNYKVTGSRDRSASFRIHSQTTYQDRSVSDSTIEWRDEKAKETDSYEFPSIFSQIAAVQHKLHQTTDEQDKKKLTIVLQQILLPYLRGFEE